MNLFKISEWQVSCIWGGVESSPSTGTSCFKSLHNNYQHNLQLVSAWMKYRSVVVIEMKLLILFHIRNLFVTFFCYVAWKSSQVKGTKGKLIVIQTSHQCFNSGVVARSNRKSEWKDLSRYWANFNPSACIKDVSLKHYWICKLVKIACMLQTGLLPLAFPCCL